MEANSTFDVTGWDAAPYDRPEEGPILTRVAIRKKFQGDLDGESTGEGLFCGLNDPEAGAGYVVSEKVTGTLAGRTGTFVLQHGGIMGPGMTPHSFGNVVPGSGTGELAGLGGKMEISRTGDGVHTLTLQYTFAEDAP